MTVSSKDKSKIYTGDGVTDTFAFTFPILDESDLLVEVKNAAGVITPKVLTTDYTVTGTGNRTGFTDYKSGNVVFGVGDIPTSTEEVIIRRSLDATQTTEYTENGVFPAETHERALDKLTMLHLQQSEEISRCIKLDPSETSFNTLIPTTTDPADLVGKYLVFDTSGTGFSLSDGTGGSGSLDPLSKADGNIIVGDGTNFVTESGATARTSLGLGTTDSVSFADITTTGTATFGGNTDVTGNITATGTLESGDVTATGDITATGSLTGAGVTSTSDVSVTGNITVTGTVDGRDIAADGTNIDTLRIGNEVDVGTSGAQSISASTTTKIQFDTEVLDADGVFDATTNYRFQPTTAGRYLITVSAQLASLASNKRVITYIYKNGSAFRFKDTYSGGVTNEAFSVVGLVTMNGTTDYVEGYIFQGDAVSRNLNASSSTRFTAVRQCEL